MDEFLNSIGLEILYEEVYPHCPIISYKDKLRQCIGCNCAAFNLNNDKCIILDNKIKSFIRPHTYPIKKREK